MKLHGISSWKIKHVAKTLAMENPTVMIQVSAVNVFVGRQPDNRFMIPEWENESSDAIM